MTDPVQSATQTVHTRTESSFFNPVTNADIKDVVREISALPAAQADKVVDALAADGTLDRVAAEIMDGSVLGLGGLSGDERQAFFADMAAKLDGDSLGALSTAFARTDERSGGFTPVTELGAAVATHAGPTAKLDYLSAIAPGAEAGHQSDYGLGYSSTTFADAEASAAGQVLGSLRGANAAEGFDRLGARLSDVLSSSVDAQMRTVASYPGGSTSMSWNASQFEAIMGAAATTSNPDLKAQVFDAGVDTMRSVRETNGVFGGLTVVGKDEALGQMTNGLAKIVDSDTSGVMRELTYNAATRDGSDFAAYAKEMLNQDREGDLGRQMARLQMGNGMNENPVERLNRSEVVPDSGGQTRLPNAGALGYFVGGVAAGVKAIDVDVAQQQAMTTAVLKSALTVVDKAKIGGPAAAAVGTAASVAKEWVQFGVKAAITNPHADAATTLAHAALPVNPATRETGVGSAVTSDFEDALSFTSQFAKP